MKATYCLLTHQNFLQDMNLQPFHLSNTSASGRIETYIFLINLTPVRKAYFITIILPIKAVHKDQLPNELHLLKNTKTGKRSCSVSKNAYF